MDEIKRIEGQATPKSGYEKFATADADRKRARYLAGFICFLVLGVLGIIGFPTVGMVCGFVYEIEIIPWIFIPFAAIPTGVLLALYCAIRASKYRFTAQLKTQIESEDVSYFSKLVPYMSVDRTNSLVQTMIDNGLLRGYSVVEGVAIVADGAYLDAETARKNAAIYAVTAKNPNSAIIEEYMKENLKNEEIPAEGGETVYYCNECGARVASDDAFCRKCGNKLS